MDERTCSAKGCDGPYYCRDLCDKHYQQFRKTGTLVPKAPLHWQRASLEARFWAKVSMGPGCWTWTGDRHTFGYGKMIVNGRKRLAHRMAREFANGPIPEGLCVCHRCDNPPCVRPSHLFLGTTADNMADMRRKGRGSKPPIKKHYSRTHCLHNHPLTPENTYLNKRGGRICRICQKEANKAHRSQPSVKAKRAADARERRRAS